MATFDSVILRLVGSPELHAKFVNSISLLEYMGARKILKSQRAEALTAGLLAHVAEEVRHAQAFKQIALKMSRGELDTYSEGHLLCGEAARGYMQTIDQGVEEALGESARTNYLLTTLLVEERASRIYPQYDLILSELGFPRALSGIIREEDAHLRDVLEELAAVPHVGGPLLGELRQLEARAFDAWMNRIEFELEAVLTFSFTGT